MEDSDQAEEPMTGMLDSAGEGSSPSAEQAAVEGCKPAASVSDPVPEAATQETAVQDGEQQEQEQQVLPSEESPGSPTNMELEDPSKETPDDGTVADDLAAIEVPFPAEYEKFWKVVEDNPEDFTGWTYLLQHAEQENHIVAARKAFDAFFSRYPYCYGYWKKYADVERRQGNIKHTEEVSWGHGKGVRFPTHLLGDKMKQPMKTCF